MKRTFSILAVAGLLAWGSSACNASSTEDATAACTDLCTASGFTGGNAEVYEHEVNCFCEGGNASARVTAEACTETCRDLGWNAGDAFASSACQCN